jgi:hypothetical protein
MDFITINHPAFSSKDSREIMDLMDCAINSGTFGLIKYGMNHSIFPWNWRFNSIYMYSKTGILSMRNASLAEMDFHS